MDGNLSREGITADFEALKQAGIGGVIMMEVDVGIPRGPVKFMSPEWRALFKHAVNEAKRLGLQITLNAGPGWTGSGGPWVKPEQSMQHLVASAVDVPGPKHYDEILPRPQRRPAFFGDGQLPPDLEKAKNDFYRDEVVLAFPTPQGNERIADIDEKALYVRAPYSSQPNVKPFLPSALSYPTLATQAVVAAERVVDLTSRMSVDGHLEWDVPEGKWTIMRFGRTSTGACTRPAPQPGLGLECDKMDPAALDAHFDAFVGTLLREIGQPTNSAGAGWTMLHIDSWEMGSQNWTATFREEFRRRRRYDPLRYLPALTGRVVESPDVTEAFLWDLRQTAQELVIQNHAQHLKDLARQRGFGLSIEPYDMMPCADMSFGAVADVPMCEFWLYGFDTTYSVIEAASIAHTCGRPIVAAESFTSGDAERWQADPGMMKPLGDWAFCHGVNRIVFHRYQHQPQLDARPGMTMGPYGVHWERTETWWDMVGAYHEYLARCQFMLRQGLPVADVCFLVPEGSPQVFRPPQSARRGDLPDWPDGYSYDGCAPETLMARMSVAPDGRLVMPDGMSYRVLVLPTTPRMTPALVHKIHALIAAGATVVGRPAARSPSLGDYGVNLWVPGSPAHLVAPLAPDFPRVRGQAYWKPGMDPARAEEPPKGITQGKWIWYKEGNPAVSAPVGTRYFRCSFTLDDKARVEAARVFMTADNSFQLWVNGREAGSGNNFHVVSVLDVKRLLRSGANVLAVAAENGGAAPNPAGLAGELVVSFAGGKTLTVPTDAGWQAAQAVHAKWTTDLTATTGWSEAMQLGPIGTAPWGTVEAPAAEPEQYCDFRFVTSLLRGLQVPPDFQADAPLRFTHRRTDEADIYFIANPEARRVEATCTFRVAGKTPELWDPLTGKLRDLPEFTSGGYRKPSSFGACTTVPLRFEPAQSFFVIFRKPAAKSPGRNFLPSAALTELRGPWTVSFDPKWGGPESVVFDALQDWTKRPEDGIRYYSGTAVYRKTFDAPRIPHRQRMYLDLGVVKNLARVRLNGKDLGVIWCAPWRVDVTDAIKPKDNHLEVSVANLWPNRLIGDQSLPPEKRLTSTTWNPFKKDSPLLQSGLLGPVTLVTERKEAAKPPDGVGLPARTAGPAGNTIFHDATTRLVTIADRGSNLVIRLNYNGGCWLDQVRVLDRPVIAPEGVYSAIRTSNGWFTTRSGTATPEVAIAGDRVTVSNIAFGGDGIQVKETWEFTPEADRILWKIDRNYGSAGHVEDAPIPCWNFQSMETWTGGLLDDGGVAWSRYLETPNATYGAHTDAVTFWNQQEDDCLHISTRALASAIPLPRHHAMRFSHQPSGPESVAFSITEQELQPRHELRRFHPSRQDLWAPFTVTRGLTQAIYALQASSCDTEGRRGSFNGLNGRGITELLNTIARYGVIDKHILGANGWRTGFTCLHEQWFSQMGIAIDDPDYLANCAATYDFERDHAIEPTGRVKSRWCYGSYDAMPGTYDTNGYYEAQWGYLMDSQPCYVICVAELFDQTGNLAWLRGQKAACERVLDYLLRRDADGDGLVEMMTDSHAQQRGSDWIDVIWASYENALVNAELYHALALWAEAEQVLGDAAHAAQYRSSAAKLKAGYNKTTAEGGFWDPQHQWYVYWRDKDGSIHGNNLVTPVQFAAIGYGLCDEPERREAILRRIEDEMQNERLFFWPLSFFPYQPDEGHAVNFPFPKYENGDIFLSWGELAVRVYAASDPATAVKYIKNVLNKYEQDGLSFQRYERKSQRGAGEDILAGNCMPVVGLYRDIFGIQPKHNRLFLDPHLTPELSGTELRYNLRGQTYLIHLDTEASRVAVGDFAVRSAKPFGLNAKGDTAEFFPGSCITPGLVVTSTTPVPIDLALETWPTDAKQARRWSESCTGSGTEIRHVVSGLQPKTRYALLRDGRKIDSLKADKTGAVRFKSTLNPANPQRFELLIPTATSRNTGPSK